jgi:hypothetical protein
MGPTMTTLSSIAASREIGDFPPASFSFSQLQLVPPEPKSASEEALTPFDDRALCGIGTVSELTGRHR